MAVLDNWEKVESVYRRDTSCPVPTSSSEPKYIKHKETFHKIHGDFPLAKI